MKQKMIIFVLLAIVGIFLLSVLFTGCTSNNSVLNDRADVKLEGFLHHETFELPSRYISTLSLTIQNKGNAIAEDIELHVNIKDNDGNEVYNKEISINSSLGIDEEKVQSIDVFYDLDDTQLDVNISISWNGGINQYTKSFTPEFKEYADVTLEKLSHYENYSFSYGYSASVILLIQNRGNNVADNVKIHVIVNDNSGNENYNKEENVMPLLLPWEITTYEITVPYDIDDSSLDFSITITWNGGINLYRKSFEPEFKEYADVKLDSMSHYEHYRLFFGYVSTVTFIIQNKGSTTADDVKIHIIALDNHGDEAYNSEMTVISSLKSGEIKSYEITIPYDFDDTQLNLSVTIIWDGGSNNYSESFEPKIFF